MKNITGILIVFVVMLLIIASCKKKDDTPTLGATTPAPTYVRYYESTGTTTFADTVQLYSNKIMCLNSALQYQMFANITYINSNLFNLRYGGSGSALIKGTGYTFGNVMKLKYDHYSATDSTQITAIDSVSYYSY